MNKRRSKDMKKLMKKVFKITILGFVLSILSVKLAKNITKSQIKQFVD